MDPFTAQISLESRIDTPIWNVILLISDSKIISIWDLKIDKNTYQTNVYNILYSREIYASTKL